MQVATAKSICSGRNAGATIPLAKIDNADKLKESCDIGLSGVSIASKIDPERVAEVPGINTKNDETPIALLTDEVSGSGSGSDTKTEHKPMRRSINFAKEKLKLKELKQLHPGRILNATDIIPPPSITAIMIDMAVGATKELSLIGLSLAILFARLISLAFLIIIAVFIWIPGEFRRWLGIAANNKALQPLGKVEDTNNGSHDDDDISDLELEVKIKPKKK